MHSFTPDNTDTGRTCSKELPVRLRRLSDLKFETLGFTERRFRPYVIAIGEATLSWNDFHETMGQLFWEICLSKCPEPMDVWQVVRNDLTNREMLKAPAAAEMKIQPRDDAVFADVKWIYDRSNELEHDRNNIIHSLPRSSKRTDKVLPATAFNKPRGKALKGKDILKEYRRLRDTAILLRDFCFKIAQAMGDDNRPWPERPRLPGRAVAKIPPPHPQSSPRKTTSPALSRCPEAVGTEYSFSR
jgi:hypothetical protein